MIFERSRRNPFLLGLAALLGAVAALAGAGYLASLKLFAPAAAAGVVGVLLALVAGRFGLKLRHWPPGRLGLFRDRLVLIQGRQEQHVPWDRIEAATLGRGANWSSGGASLISISDRLTLRMRRSKGPAAVTFRPADFGLDPVSCRDLLFQLREEAGARERLPEFDSELDLSLRPIVSGELISPRI